MLEELKLKDHPVQKSTMERVNDVIEEFVAREGNVECEKLAKMLVIRLRPSDQQNNGLE
jgi:uncharacterized protein YheU (UPF0270 family)